MKVVILGDGILGSEIQNQTGWNNISRKVDGLDISSESVLRKIVYEYDIIVNCIAYTNSYSTDSNQHLETNFKFPARLSDICSSFDKKLVHISTEFVYANNSTPPSEEDLPIPDSTWYAYSKLLGDEYIKLTNTNFLICRELHKPNNFNYPEVWDVKTSGDKVGKIAELIIKLINKNASGVFNVGTGDKNLKDLNPEGKLVEAPAHVPKDTRMNLDKLNKFLCQE